MSQKLIICLKCHKVNGFAYHFEGFYRCGEFPISNKKLCDNPVFQLEKYPKSNL